MSTRIPIQELLVQRGLAKDIKHAQALVLSGKVLGNEQRITKPGDLVPFTTQIRVKGSTSNYVSRAGDKLEGALLDFNLVTSMKNAVVLDIGSSTGGFTDCALQFGAHLVYAVDVGTNQLDWKLRNHKQVIVNERTDIRNYNPPDGLKFDFVLCDVSFTSITIIASAMLRLGHPDTHYLLLIKPQFEADRSLVEEGGLIRDETVRQMVIEKTIEDLSVAGFAILEKKDSRLRGRTGNLESWIYCRKSS